jgi:ribonuclease Z
MSKPSDFRVTLIGTGTPVPRPDRFGPCTLVEAGNQTLLIDAGRGATMRLYQLGIPMGRIDVLFLTHYHSDHTSGIPDLWLTGWLSSHYARRTKPMRVIGPVGAKVLMSRLAEAYAADIKIRLDDEKLPPEGVATIVEEFDHDGVVYEADGVKVIAFEVDHGDVIKPCYGYRFEYQGRSAVLSSDTRYNQNVIKYGRGADLLVHEVATARPELMIGGLCPAHHGAPHHAARGGTGVHRDQAEACCLYAPGLCRERKSSAADRRRSHCRDAPDLRRPAPSRRRPDAVRDR